MGQKESSSSNLEKDKAVSGGGENIPYTNYSVEKKAKSLKAGEIVTVQAAPLLEVTDPELLALREIPKFYPILKSSVAQKWFSRSREVRGNIDLKPALSLCHELQEFFKSSVVLLSSEQDVLAARMKNMETSCSTVLYNCITVLTEVKYLQEHLAEVDKSAVEIGRLQETYDRLAVTASRLTVVVQAMEKLEKHYGLPGAEKEMESTR